MRNLFPAPFVLVYSKRFFAYEKTQVRFLSNVLVFWERVKNYT